MFTTLRLGISQTASTKLLAPQDVHGDADSSTGALGWNEAYCVNADHITKETDGPFISCSDFFTIDVAAYIGKQAETADKDSFFSKNAELVGSIKIPGIEEDWISHK